MTKYRKISNGYVNHLQYLKESKFLFFFTRREWVYVWRPYFHRSYGRTLDVCGYDTFVCSYNGNLEDFVKRWPNVEDYFKWAEQEQNKLEEAVAKKDAERDKKKGEIEYL